MPAKKVSKHEPDPEVVYPEILPKARSDEARERQLVNAAYDLAEKQLQEGTASSAVIAHFLKMGSKRNREEMDNLKQQNALLKAKVGQIASQEDNEKIAKDAISALKNYSGDSDEEA